MNYNSTFIIGNRDTGKTRKKLFYEIENKLETGESFVILDIHKEYYNHFMEKFQVKGYRINVIDLKNAKHSDGWNPLSYPFFLMNQEVGEYDLSIEQLENMANEIFYDKDEIDPFWRVMSQNLFIGLCLLLRRISSKNKDIHLMQFPTTMLLLSVGEEKMEDSSLLRKYVESLDATDPIYVALSPIVFAPAETKGSILSVFKMKMNRFFLREDLVKSMLNNCYSEDLVGYQKTVVFLENIPNTLTNIFIGQCFTEAYRNSNSITFILDEFDQLPHFVALEEKVKQSRKSNVSVYLATSNPEMISMNYPSLAVEETISLTDIYQTDYQDKDVPYQADPMENTYLEGYSKQLKEEFLKLF